MNPNLSIAFPFLIFLFSYNPVNTVDKPILTPAGLVNEPAVANVLRYCWKPGSSTLPTSVQIPHRRVPLPSPSALGPLPPPGLCAQLTPMPKAEASSARVLLGSLCRVPPPQSSPKPPNPYPSPLQISTEGLDENLALSWPTHLRQHLHIGARQRIEGGPLGAG